MDNHDKFSMNQLEPLKERLIQTETDKKTANYLWTEHPSFGWGAVLLGLFLGGLTMWLGYEFSRYQTVVDLRADPLLLSEGGPGPGSVYRMWAVLVVLFPITVAILPLLFIGMYVSNKFKNETDAKVSGQVKM